MPAESSPDPFAPPPPDEPAAPSAPPSPSGPVAPPNIPIITDVPEQLPDIEAPTIVPPDR